FVHFVDTPQLRAWGNMFGFGHHSPPILERTWFKIFCRADEGFSLTVRDDAVVLVGEDDGDEHQHWYKDTRHSGSVKDEEGQPAFTLVNKATGLAIKHSLGQSHPVELVPYNQEYRNESLMWTESEDVGKGYRCIRMASNIDLNFDAFHGDKDHGGVRDGTTLVLWEWCNVQGKEPELEDPAIGHGGRRATTGLRHPRAACAGD
uniref:Agglutinin domain-containing protein n=1 Tax=Aegilops tauschii subsp. strangulata TaxID=200361 RepID=A0A453A7S6_AEGTS